MPGHLQEPSQRVLLSCSKVGDKRWLCGKTKGAGRKVGVKFLEAASRVKGSDFFTQKTPCEQLTFGLDKENYELSFWNPDFPGSDIENAFSFLHVPD